VVSNLLKSMQDLPISAITQKEGGTQLKLIIDFQVSSKVFVASFGKI
jgi:hypothetical protein